MARKDGWLIARHEPNISSTTDVASRPEFASRKRTAIVDGIEETGWFASDFTLAEIKTLRAIQPASERSQAFNGRYRIPTLEQVIALAKRHSRTTGRTIGIYPETKHPTYHRSLRLRLEGRLVKALKAAGWNRRRAPVSIQSCEQSNLLKLNRLTKVRLVQLIDAYDVNPNGTLAYTAPYDRPYDWTRSGRPELLARTFGYFATNAGLAEVATYADGIGPWCRTSSARRQSTPMVTGRWATRTATAWSTRPTGVWWRRATSSPGHTPAAWWSTRTRSATSSAGSYRTSEATRSTSTSASTA